MTKRKRRELAEALGAADGVESKQDHSPHVAQGEKVSFELTIRDFPWTEKQRTFIEAGVDKRTNYILCEAPPGVGKTLMSVYIGLRLLERKAISKIYFVRLPQESASKGIGFVPGTSAEKMEAFGLPMMDQLNQLLPPAQIAKLTKEGFIEVVPIGFIKGRTFNNALVIVDEVEDLSKQELLLVMGRLGKYSKMLLIGDYQQANVRNSGFKAVFDGFNDPECMEKGIFCLSFDESDIKRNGIIAYVVKRFRAMEMPQMERVQKPRMVEAMFPAA